MAKKRIMKSQYRAMAAMYIASTAVTFSPDMFDGTDLDDDEKEILTEHIRERCNAISPDDKVYGSIAQIVNSVLNG